ncbi:MAG: hypothetical protein WCJ35_16480 [Planctomycetota bacterium]
MSTEEGKQGKAAPNEGGREENADPRHDASEAVATEEAATSEASTKLEKRKLLRVELAALVLHRGSMLISVPENNMRGLDKDKIVYLIHQDVNLENLFIDLSLDEISGVSHFEILEVEEVEDDPQTAPHKAVLNETGEWCLQ